MNSTVLHLVALMTFGGSVVAARVSLPEPRILPPDSQLSARVALSGGMGVHYISMPEIVDYVNATAAGVGARERLSEFKAGVGFFGAVVYPLSPNWTLKGEYVYLLVSYTPDVPTGVSEFTAVVHMPTLVLQYVLADEGLYNLKAGAGVGYHAGSLTSKYAFVNTTMSAGGMGVLLELEANTAFGDHLFAFLGTDLRWEFLGTMSGGQGQAPQTIGRPDMHGIGIGFRLGFSYYF